MEKIIWYLPLKTVSEGNSSEHWTAKSKRHRQQQFFVRALFSSWQEEISLPCTVKMVRLSPRMLDAKENLPMAFKWIADEISECLIPEKRGAYVIKKGTKSKSGNVHKKTKIIPIKGRADDSSAITWVYDQEKSPTLGIRIEIESEAMQTQPLAQSAL